MHMIEMTKQTGNKLAVREIVYKSRSYNKAVAQFLNMVAHGEPVALVSIKPKQIGKGGKA